MTSKEFSMKCKSYNIKYRYIFGNVPCPQNYVGTRDDFFNALVKAVEEQKPISEYLRAKTVPSGENIKI